MRRARWHVPIDEVLEALPGPEGQRSAAVFTPGDLLFLPAGVGHRFVQFSDDLAVWVVFSGPQGGDGAG